LTPLTCPRRWGKDGVKNLGLEKMRGISIVQTFIFLEKKMTTITTTVPFAVKEQHMDIKQLVKKYVDYIVKQDKALSNIEINFGKK
jgi:hypothetical protein